MTEASGGSGSVAVEHDLLAEVVTQQLEAMLAVGNYDAVKLLLRPVQPVDIAEAIGALPSRLQAIAFRLLAKDEAISVYEYLDTPTQQNLLGLLRSGEMRDVMEEMSPDDRTRLFEELPAKAVRQLLSELSPEERRVTAELLGYEAETAGRLMTTEYVALKENQTAAVALEIVRRRARDTETIYSLVCHRCSTSSDRDPFAAGPAHRRSSRARR